MRILKQQLCESEQERFAKLARSKFMSEGRDLELQTAIIDVAATMLEKKKSATLASIAKKVGEQMPNEHVSEADVFGALKAVSFNVRGNKVYADE